jgi:hypothetical protein
MKLGLHVMDEGQRTAIATLNQIPMDTIKVIVDLDSLRNDATMELLHLAQAKGVMIVGRRYNDDNPDLDSLTPRAEARKYFDGVGTSGFKALADAFPMVKIWEGPNEPDCKTPERMAKYAEFCAEFVWLMYSETGERAGIGAWAVGTPEIDMWQHFKPALDAVKTYHAVLTRHSYGPIAGDEGTWFGLRHRRDQAEFARLGCPNMPLLITECGTDTLWNATAFNKPWRELYGHGDDALPRYWAEWGKPFEEAIAQDNYVIGAHWFTVGNGGSPNWINYDLAHLPIAETVLANPPVIIAPPPIVVPPPVVPPPATEWPEWATHQVTATALNVRQFPWLGNVTPPIVGQLAQGDYVRSYNVDGNWHRIGPDGNKWVSGRYLKE